MLCGGRCLRRAEPAFIVDPLRKTAPEKKPAFLECLGGERVGNRVLPVLRVAAGAPHVFIRDELQRPRSYATNYNDRADGREKFQ